MKSSEHYKAIEQAKADKQKFLADLAKNKQLAEMRQQELNHNYQMHKEGMALKNKELMQNLHTNYFNISSGAVKGVADNTKGDTTKENLYESIADGFSENNMGFLGKAFFKGLAIKERGQRETKEAEEKRKVYEDYLNKYGDVIQYLSATNKYAQDLMARQQVKDQAEQEIRGVIDEVGKKNLTEGQSQAAIAQAANNASKKLGEPVIFAGIRQGDGAIIFQDEKGQTVFVENPYYLGQLERQNQNQANVRPKQLDLPNTTPIRFGNRQQQQQSQEPMPQQQQMPNEHQQQQENDQFANLEPLSDIKFNDPTNPRRSYTLTANNSGKFFASDVSRLPEPIKQSLLDQDLVVDDPTEKDRENAQNHLFGDDGKTITLIDKYDNNANILYKVDRIEKAINSNSWQGWSKPIQDFFSRISSKNQNIKNIIDSGSIDFVILAKEIFGQAITQSEFKKILEGVPNSLMGKEAAQYLLGDIKNSLQQKNENIKANVERYASFLTTRDQKRLVDTNSPYSSLFPNLKKKSENDQNNQGVIDSNTKNDNMSTENPVTSEEPSTPNQDGSLMRFGKNVAKGVGEGITQTVDALSSAGDTLSMTQGGEGDGPGLWGMAFANANGKASDSKKEPNFSAVDWYHKKIGYDPKTADFSDKLIINFSALASMGPRGLLKLPFALANLGASTAMSMENPYEVGTLKSKAWDLLAPVIGGVAGGLSPAASKAIKNTIANAPKSSTKALVNILESGVTKDISKENLLDLKNLLEKDFSGFSALDFVNADKQTMRTKFAKNIQGKVELDPQQIAKNNQIISRDVAQKIGVENLDKSKLTQAISSTEKPNAKYNKMLEELKNNTDKVHFPETESYLKEFFKTVENTAGKEEIIAAKKTLGNIKLLIKEDNPFLNIYEKQLNNNFANFTKNNKSLVEANVVKAMGSSPIEGFNDFVFNVGQKGVDVTKYENVKNLLKTYNQIGGKEYVKSENGIISGFLDNLKLSPKEVLEVRNSIKEKFLPFVERHTQNVKLAQIKSQLTKEFRSLFKDADSALGGIAANKSEPGYELARALYSKEVDLEKVSKLIANPAIVRSFEKIIPPDSAKYFENLKKIVAFEKLQKFSADPKKIIQELMSPDKEGIFKALLGEDYNRIISDVGDLHKLYSKANAASTVGEGASKIGGVAKTAGLTALFKLLGIPLPVGAAVGFGASKGLSRIGKDIGKRLNSNEFTKKVIARAEKNAQSK